MTVSANDRRIQYTATASQTVFPYDFQIDANTEITVLQTIYLTGVTNTLTLTTHYTISGVGVAGGGNVTLVTGAALDDTITIIAATALTRPTDFNQAGDFFADDVNLQLDRITRILQENETTANRTLLLRPEDTSTSLELPIASDRANTFLAFDASGNPIAAAGTAGVTVSTFMKTLLDDTTAADARATLGITGALIGLGTLAGIANTYTATSSAAYTSYTADDAFLFKVNVDNTGASTINVSSVGVKDLQKFDGAGAATALESGDLQADQYYTAIYNGTAVIVLNPQKPHITVTVPTATETVAGIAEIATNAETLAGTETGAKFLNPANLLSLFGASILSTTGSVKIPVNVGGAFTTFIIKWGTGVAGSGNKTLTFAEAFPNACTYINMYNDDATAFRNFELNINSAASFDYESVSLASTDPRWTALGY